MRVDHVAQVAQIHARVLPESIYTALGRSFLEYYYRALLANEDFACHVHEFEGRVTGFLASSSASGRVFMRQIARDLFRIGMVLGGAVARHPARAATIVSATRFLFAQRRTMLADVPGEVLSFAVLPEFRTTELAADGTLRATPFYERSRIPVATELFVAALEELGRRGVEDVKIMTGEANHASNRFYSKMGCVVAVRGLQIFGEGTVLYRGRVRDMLAHLSGGVATRHGD